MRSSAVYACLVHRQLPLSILHECRQASCQAGELSQALLQAGVAMVSGPGRPQRACQLLQRLRERGPHAS